MSDERPAVPTVELLPGAMADERRVIDDIADLVNRVYAVAEDGLWRDGAARTTAAEIAELVAAGQIACASVGADLVGSVRVQRLDDVAGEFGMLAAGPAHRGVGVGRELVRFAEQLSRDRGLTVMQLELLVPRDWSHPVKDFLHAWYTRIGYRPVRTGRIDDDYPHLAPLLATPCDFVVYHKPLVARASTTDSSPVSADDVAALPEAESADD